MKQQEQFAQIMVESAPYAIAMADLQGVFIYANSAFYKLLGLDPEDGSLAGKPITSIIAEDEIDTLEDMIEQATNKGIWQGEARMAKQDGTPLFVQLNIFPLEEDEQDDQPKALAAIMHEITAEKKAQKALSESEERFRESLARRERQLRLTTDIAQSIGTSSNLEEIYQRVVTAVKEQFDYYHAQIFRHAPEENAMVVIEGYGEIGEKMVADGHNLPYGKGVVGTAASTGEPVLAADVSEDPNWVPHPDLPDTKGELAVPIKWQDQVLGILDVQHDQPCALTEEDQLVLMGLAGQIGIAIESARLLEELRQSEEEYRQVIENQGEGLGITDTDENFIFANPAAARIFGVPEGELVGHNLNEFVDEETYQDIGDQTEQRREGETSVYEFEFTRTDGEKRIGLVTASPRHNEEGEFTGTFGIFRDITERIEAERKLNKRVKELNLISDVGQRIAEEPSIPDLLQWMAERIPAAMQYSEICTAAIEYRETLYGDPEAKALRCQNVAGIRLNGERVGRIYIAYAQKRDFLDEESAMLGSVVQRVESYLARLHSTEELEQRARRERIIREITARVRQRTDPEAIVRAAVRELGATLERPTFIRLGDAEELSQPPESED
jgi:PAS domain S-box-containing protein